MTTTKSYPCGAAVVVGFGVVVVVPTVIIPNAQFYFFFSFMRN
jgi:hypothetical protein